MSSLINLGLITKGEKLSSGWYDVPNYEGIYKINKNGQVKKVSNNKLMSLCTDRNGYKFYHLTSSSGKRRTELQHRLIAKVFLPNPDNFPMINHKDEKPSNNNIDNLEWCTHTYNMNYGGKIAKTIEKNSKKVYCYFIDGSLDKIYKSTQETSKDGYEPKHVSDCALGKRKTHKKRIWSYEKLNNQEVCCL